MDASANHKGKVFKGTSQCCRSDWKSSTPLPTGCQPGRGGGL